MRLSGWTVTALTTALAACAYGARTSVRAPLGAVLSPTARTGASVPLHFDPNARVILSTAAGLPAASFLPSQAARGAQIYEQSCGTCHEPGQLIGRGFVEAWNNRRVYDLYALVRGTMPLDSPGAMKDGEYLDVIAYLLQANKHVAASADSLRGDTLTLRTTRIAVSVP
ncbi:MAG TPA: cytochrome c [Gemmatimonadaceae bacterium]|nr:cytochrome c [Gemmatimonadaceae bacterium]